MQVSLTATCGLERRLEVAVPAQRVSTEVEQRLKQISRTARLKGFRPGKAPYAVIKSQYGDQVRGEVISDLIRSSYRRGAHPGEAESRGQPAHRAPRGGSGCGPQVRRHLRGAARDHGEARWTAIAVEKPDRGGHRGAISTR